MKKYVFFGCKVDQNDPIVIKLYLDMCHCLQDVYTKFQIDISRHVENNLGKLRLKRYLWIVCLSLFYSATDCRVYGLMINWFVD